MNLKDNLTKPLYQKSFDGDSYHTYILFENMDVILEEQVKVAKEYAKEKCKELLEIVVEKAKVTTIWEGNTSSEYVDYDVDKDSILNAVDLNTFIV